MQHFRKCLLFWLVFCSAVLLHAQTNTYRYVEFSCSAIPQANINGVTTASEIHATATNTSSEKVFTRYRIVVTSSQGRVQDYGEVGKGNFAPQAVETHDFTTFSKASVQDEFPKACKFTQIQVCPANAPTGFPKGSYYRPFIDGGKECKAVGNITITLVAPKTKDSGCTAITRAFIQTGPPYGTNAVYAVGEDPTSVEGAVAVVTAKLPAPNYNLEVIAKGCGHAHGAVAASPKRYGAGGKMYYTGPGMYEEYGAALADSPEEAARLALEACKARPIFVSNHYEDDCQPIKSW